MNLAALNAALNGDLSNLLVASQPGGIERQEAQGQRDLVESSSIPKEIRGATREQLTAIGFKFGKDIDELFVSCKLPAGWKKNATEHSMHSDLLDEQGRRRASIFYKAAFYDRRADMYMKTRFLVDSHADTGTPEKFRCIVKDGDAVVFDAGTWARPDYAAHKALQEKASAWLEKNRPDYQNPLAYW